MILVRTVDYAKSKLEYAALYSILTFLDTLVSSMFLTTPTFMNYKSKMVANAESQTNL